MRNAIYKLKVGGLLHPRKLEHFIQETLNAADPCDVTWAGADVNLLAGYDYDCSDGVIKEVVIPLAVAASVVVIVEGTQVDDSGYYALANSLSKFEHTPTTNALVSSATANSSAMSQANAYSSLASVQTSAGQVDLAPYDTQGLKFVENQQCAIDAKDAFLAGQTNLGQFLQIIFEEQARGRGIEAGINLDSTGLSQIAKAQIDRMKAMGRFFRDGSLPKYTQAKACADLPAASANQLSQAEIANLQATCDGTKDSDGDGVPDLIEQCITSPRLLANGGTVGPDGCMFGDSQAVQPDPTAPNPSARIVGRSLPRPDGGSPTPDSATP